MLFPHPELCNSFSSCIEIIFTYHASHPLKVYNSWLFNVFTELYDHRHNQFKNICLTSKSNPRPISNHSLSPLTPVLFILPDATQTTTNLLSVYLDLQIVDMSHIESCNYDLCQCSFT